MPSQVCEVMTDPSAEAFFPTMMLVHERCIVGSSTIFCDCAIAKKGITAKANVANKNFRVFIGFVFLEVRGKG